MRTRTFFNYLESVIVEIKILFSFQLLIRSLAQEVLDEPLAEHGEIGNGRDESRGDNVTSTHRGNSPSYLLRRLARDGISWQVVFLHNNSNTIQCDCLKLSEHKRKIISLVNKHFKIIWKNSESFYCKPHHQVYS